MFEVLRQERLETTAGTLDDGFREHRVAEQVFDAEKLAAEVKGVGLFHAHAPKMVEKTAANKSAKGRMKDEG